MLHRRAVQGGLGGSSALAAGSSRAACFRKPQVGCYQEVYRVLKPGGCFAGYEWCATDKYDPSNPEHKSVRARRGRWPLRRR